MKVKLTKKVSSFHYNGIDNKPGDIFDVEPQYFHPEYMIEIGQKPPTKQPETPKEPTKTVEPLVTSVKEVIPEPELAPEPVSVPESSPEPKTTKKEAAKKSKS